MVCNIPTPFGGSGQRAARGAALACAWLSLLGTLPQCSDEPLLAPADAVDSAADTAAPTPDTAQQPSDTLTDQTTGVPDAPVADVEPGIPCKINSDCPVATAPCTEARCEATTLTCRIVQVVDQTPCDDGESCTVGDQCQGGSCVAGKNACGCTADGDCQGFDDGNACNGKWFCDTSLSPSQCAPKPGSQVVCPPPDDPCKTAICKQDSGACSTIAKPDGSACDDGKVCTSGDTCQAGQCVGGTNTCPCSKTADCQDDGDLCNGVPYCDKSELPWTCKTNPGSVVYCSAAGDTACAKNTCDPKLGTCSLQPTNQGGPCNDGETCTVGDSCDAGLCKAGPNGCGCQSNADCAPLDDGDLCNGTLYCNKTVQPHVCQVNPASVVVCPSVDDTACKKNLCQKTSGVCQMTNVADATACSDGNPCTADEACKGGACVAATNTCPCQNTADCTAKDDADLCNGTLFCDKSKLPYQCEVNPATVVQCPGGTSDPCARNLCQPKTGECAITPVNEGATCDADNNFCTQGDVCKQGLCSAGPNTCPCSKDADCLPFDDGNACNGTLYCDKVAQKCLVNPNTLVVCNSANDSFCLANQCQPSTGQCAMTPRNQGVSCDADSNPCTVGDVCQSGTCVAGTNTCSCASDAECAPFEDGNLCNGTLMCDKSALPYQCKVNPKTVVLCPAGKPGPCEINTCVPSTGACAMAPLPDYTACSDGQICTFGDVCQAGKCVAGTNLCQCTSDADCASQDDGNQCNGTLYCDKSSAPFQCKVNPKTVVVCPAGEDQPCVKNLCQKTSGLCAMTTLADGAGCDDGNVCTKLDACAKGSCDGAAIVCSDGDVCTLDDCDPISGCLTIANAVAACDDGNACSADSCDAKAGCKHSPLDSGVCDDGNPCTGPDTCKSGVCGGSLALCDDGNPCTDDGCGADGKSCEHKNNHAACGGDLICDEGHCGGCRAFYRVQRQGCDLVTGWPFYDGIADACKIDKGYNTNREEFEDTVVLSDGRIAAVGATSTDGSNATKGWIAWFSNQGAWGGDKTYGVAGTARLQAAVADGAGGLWASGQNTSSQGVVRPWLLHVDAQGKVLAELTVADPAGNGALSAGLDGMVATADGGAVAVGWTQTAAASTTDALAVRVDSAGKLVWFKAFASGTLPSNPQNARFWAVVAPSDGSGFVAAGHRINPKALANQTEGWLLKLDQTGALVWQRDLGGLGHDQLFGLTQRSDGSLVAVGTRGKPTVTGPGDAWIVRTDSQGLKPTFQTIAGLGDDVLRMVAPGPLGGLLVAGYQAVDHTGDATWSAGYDRGHAWALRLDDKGDKVWEQTYDQYGAERLLGGMALAEGDLIAAGDTRGAAYATDQPPDKPDGLLLRLDVATGMDACPCNLTARTDSKAGAPARLEKVITASDGTVVAAGWQTSPTAGSQGWLQRMDGNTNLIWSKQYGKQGGERLSAVVADGTGFAAVGWTDSAGAGGKDGWFLRVDGEGNVLGEAMLGGFDDDLFTAILALPQGGFILAGASVSGSKGKEDAWVVRVDSKGVKLWEQRFGSTLDDRFNALTLVGPQNAPRILALGYQTNVPIWGTPQNGYQVVLDLDGKVQLDKAGKELNKIIYWDLDKEPAGSVFQSVAPMPNGGAVGVGITCSILQCGGWWVWFNELGETTGTGKMHGGVVGGRLNAVLPESDGGFVAVGAGNGPGGPDDHGEGWAVRIGPDGKQRFFYNGYHSVIPGDPSPRGFFGLTRLFTGHYVAVGQTDHAELGTTGFALNLDAFLYTGTMRFNGAATDENCSTVMCTQFFPPRARNKSALCYDGNPCSDQDFCYNGQCQQSRAHVCDDGNPCTTEECWAEGGCVPTGANDGAVCGGNATCSAGNCGTCPYVGGTWTPAGGYDAPAVAVGDGGGGHFVGGRTVYDPANPSNGWVSHLDSNGNALWSTVLDMGAAAEGLAAVVTQTDGSVWAYGWVDGSADRDRYRVHLGADGKVLEKTVDALPEHQMVLGATPLGGGSALLAGRTGAKAWIGTVDATGKLLSELSFAPDAVNQYLLTHVVPTSGGYLAAGMAAAGTNVVNGTEWVVRIDATGKILWQSTENTPWGSYGGTWRNLMVDPATGDITVGGSFWNGGDWGVGVLRLTSAGKIRWKYYLNQVSQQNVYTALQLADSSILLAGSVNHWPWGTHTGWFLRISPAGELISQFALQKKSPWYVTNLVPGPGNLITAFGLAPNGDNSKGVPQWHRISPDGGVTCSGVAAP